MRHLRSNFVYDDFHSCLASHVVWNRFQDVVPYFGEHWRHGRFAHAPFEEFVVLAYFALAAHHRCRVGRRGTLVDSRAVRNRR